MKKFGLWLRENGLWKNLFIICLLLVFASQCTPWFSASPGVVPSHGGVGFGGGGPASLIFFLLYVFMILHLWKDWYNPLTTILAMAGFLTLPVFTTAAFYMWPYYAFMTRVPQLDWSWSSVQPWYWISLGISVLPIVMYPLYLLEIAKRDRTASPQAAR